jgi:hypothetical protein
MSQDQEINGAAASPKEESPKPEEKRAETTTDLLARIASTGPIWLRTLALIALLITTITPYWQKVSDWIDDEEMNRILKTTVSISDPTTNTEYSPAKGQKVPAPPDAQRLAANALSPEDSKELTRHIAVLQEVPHFKRLLVNQKKGVVAYSIFPSDGCILINHITSHSLKLDLVRAEEPPTRPDRSAFSRPLVIPEPGSKSANSDSDQKPRFVKADFLSESVDWDRPALKSTMEWSLQDHLTLDDQEKQPVQGTCLNPHPGQFRYWSQPVAACVEQVWRQWPDGCTHYQIHNFCNNLWDPAIHWTFCAAQHAY